MHKIARALVLSSLVPLLFSCKASSAGPERTWLVASDLANPPFAWLDDTDHPQGRDVEMARLLATEMNAQLEWKQMEFAVLLGALERGDVDAVIATMGATPERAERVLLSNPYFTTSLRVIVRRGADEPTRLVDLAGRQVSAGLGTTSERALRDRLPNAIPAAPTRKGADSIDRLLAGEVDALIMDGPDAFDFAREYPSKLSIIEEPLDKERYVVLVRPTGEDWVVRINAAILAIRETGAMSGLDHQFGLTPDIH